MKKINQALSDRVKMLEDILRSNGIEIPPDSNPDSPSSDSNAAPARIDERMPNASEELSFDTGPEHLNDSQDWIPQFPDTSNEVTSASTSAWDAFMSFDQSGDMPTLTASKVQPENSSQNGVLNAIKDAQNTSNDSMINPELKNSRSDAAVIFNEDDPKNSVHEDLESISLNGRAVGGQIRRQSSVEWHNDNAWSYKQNTSQIRTIEHVRPTQSDEMIDQLSARMGSFQLAEDGQLRYFGATSNLHILHNGAFSLSRTPTRSIRTEGSSTLHRAGIGQEVDQEFEKHLEELYFTWEDPAIHVVDEEMYYLEQAKWNSGEDGSPFYSETLKNAMQVDSLTNHLFQTLTTYLAAQLGQILLCGRKWASQSPLLNSSVLGRKFCWKLRWIALPSLPYKLLLS